MQSNSHNLPKKLEQGFARFKRERFAREEQHYKSIAMAAQQPKAFVISCCDSRVSPEIIFDVEPGDIFVMRNIANIVPPFELSGQYHGTSAALDFAVRQLAVSAIIVLGHSGCGGIAALASPNSVPHGEFLGPWLHLIDKEMHHSHDGVMHNVDLRAMEYQCVKNSLGNLMTFPWIASRFRAGTLDIVGAHFDVGKGELRVFDSTNDQWVMPSCVSI